MSNQLKASLLDLSGALAAAVGVAAAGEASQEWDLAYTLIFSDQVAGRIREVLKAVGLSFPDYYDPDSSYEEDTLAYARACGEFKERIDRMAEALP